MPFISIIVCILFPLLGICNQAIKIVGRRSQASGKKEEKIKLGVSFHIVLIDMVLLVRDPFETNQTTLNKL